MNKRIAALWKFLTYDIWRITEDEVTRTTFSVYNIIKTIYLCINRFTKDRIVNKASALTYSMEASKETFTFWLLSSVISCAPSATLAPDTPVHSVTIPSKSATMPFFAE